MLEYYKNKMIKAYEMYQEALDACNESGAEMYMKDYLNYKEMYDR